MSGSFYERVLVNIRERQAFYEGKILNGNLTLEEYKTMTGKLFGLKESEDEVKEAYKALFEDRIKE